MARPTFLAFPVLLALLVHAAVSFTPLPQWAQTAVLLNNTIYSYGGQVVGNSVGTNFYTLDVSIAWSITSPAWADHTSDAGTVTVPQVAFGVIFPAYDNQSFYIWGGEGNSPTTLLENGFAQYSLASKQWALPSYITNMPLQRKELSAVINSLGVAYIWAGFGNSYTGYPTVSPLSYEKIFNDMITFDTVKQIWNTINVSGVAPTPRILHTLTMLPNNQMIVIGGLTGTQVNVTYVEYDYALMSDVPIFDTNTATWTSNNATGNVPAVRRGSTAVLADDGISIIIFGGGTAVSTVNLNDVAVLNTMTMKWSQPTVSGNLPAGRMVATSVITNGQMVIMLGYDNTNNGLSDVAVLDTRQGTYSWVSNFTPKPTLAQTTTPTASMGTGTTASPGTASSSSSSSSLSAIGGVGGVAAIAIGGVLIVAIIVLLVLKPWRKRNNSNNSQVPGNSLADPPPQPPAQYVSSTRPEDTYVAGLQPQYNVQPQYNNMNPQMQYNNMNPQMQYNNMNPQMQYNNMNPQMQYNNVNPQQYSNVNAQYGQPAYGNPQSQYGPPMWSNQGGYDQPVSYLPQDYSQQKPETSNGLPPNPPKHISGIASPKPDELPVYLPMNAKPNLND